MRQIGAMLFLFFQISVSGQQPAAKEKKFERHITKDINGFSFESFDNDPAGVRIYTLKNGLKVYLAKNTDEPRIRTIVALKAGSAYDPPDNTGLAHYLEHLLFSGTDKLGTLNWNKEQPLLLKISDLFEAHKKENDSLKKKIIYQVIDSLSLEASKYGIRREYDKLATELGMVLKNGITYPDFTAYLGLIPAGALEKFLALEVERFRDISLRNFHSELEVVFEEFNTEQDRVFKQKYYAITSEMFEDHPYGTQQVIGTAEHLKNPSLKAIRKYFDKYYVPNNMAVILIGDLDFEKTIRLVDASFGRLSSRPLNKPVFTKEKQLTRNKEIIVTGPDPESVYIGYRLNGAGSEDEKYLALLDLMLTNGVAGLLDINLNARQLVKNAQSSLIRGNDYIMHFIDGYPKKGQTLKEVESLIIKVIDDIKKGAFDASLMQAAVSDLKRRKSISLANVAGLDGEIMYSFVQGKSWDEALSFVNGVASIKKQQLIDFVIRNYKNYVVLYKQQGINTNLVKVANPQITPIRLNQDSVSHFGEMIRNIPVTKTKFQPIDFSSNLHHSKLNKGISIIQMENKKNDLFQLDLIWEMGKANIMELPVAIDYLDYLGTARMTNEQIKQQFYKMGIDFSARSGERQTVIHIEGLSESFVPAIELLDEILTNSIVDKMAFNKMVQATLNARSAAKTNKRIILSRLADFVLYNENAPTRNTFSQKQLEAIEPGDLIEIIRELRNFKHQIFYYGNHLGEVKEKLNHVYRPFTADRAYPTAKQYSIHKTGATIYFVNNEQVQTDVMLLSRGEQFDLLSKIQSNMFNRYIEKVVDQEIRQKRSLSYGGFAAHIVSEDTSGYDYSMMSAGSQANKLFELLDVMTGLMRKTPGSAELFTLAKADQLKRYEAERVNGTNIFWTYLANKKQGVDYDFRKTMYETIQNMSFTDMDTFFNKNIGNREYSILIVGNRKDIDFNKLQQYGRIQEVDLDYLFNYK